MDRIHVEATGRRVAPFDDPAGDVLIGNRRLADWQADAIRDAGLVQIPEPTPPCLVIPDTTFTNGEVLKRFLAGAGDRNAVLVLARSRFADSTVAVQPDVEPVEAGWRFSRIRIVTGDAAPPIDVVVDPDEYIHNLELPAAYGGPTPIALPRHPLVTVHHWVHLLWANTAAQSMVARRKPAWRAALDVLWAIVRARSLNPWRVMAKLSTFGRKCDIHPTAVVEASTLGDEVTVGPFARVAFSHIGDGATIMSGAEVEACTIGPGATVGQRCGVRLCVLYPEAMASQIQMQACVLGRRTVTATGSYSIDLNFEQDIRVMFDGKLVSTGTRFLGSAFGHDCRIGTGIWLASGRSIPNGTVMVRHPEGVVQRIPASPGDRPLFNDRGTLRPIGD